MIFESIHREESDSRMAVAGRWTCEDCGAVVANDAEICVTCEAAEMEEEDFWPEDDGQPDEAQEWYEASVKWVEEFAPENPDLHRFRQEASDLLHRFP